MLVFGIILIVLGAIFGVVSYFKAKRVYSLRSVERRNAGDVASMAHEVSEAMAEFGPTEGTFAEKGEFLGDAVCDQPVTAQLSGKPCLYYSMKVKRKYEEKEWDSDQDRWRTRTGYQTVTTSSEYARFKLKDDTGEILVDPEGAKFDGLVDSVSKFEPAQGARPALSFGRFQLSLGNQYVDTEQRRTIGYEYKEKILPMDRRLTVIGEANDKMGELAVRKSKDQKLTISTRSREEMVESAKKAKLGFMIAGIACGALGVILAIVGAVS